MATAFAGGGLGPDRGVATGDAVNRFQRFALDFIPGLDDCCWREDRSMPVSELSLVFGGQLPTRSNWLLRRATSTAASVWVPSEMPTAPTEPFALIGVGPTDTEADPDAEPRGVALRVLRS